MKCLSLILFLTINALVVNASEDTAVFKFITRNADTILLDATDILVIDTSRICIELTKVAAERLKGLKHQVRDVYYNKGGNNWVKLEQVGARSSTYDPSLNYIRSNGGDLFNCSERGAIIFAIGSFVLELAKIYPEIATE